MMNVVLPVLAALWPGGMSPAKPLKNIGRATCYVNAVVQSWVTNVVIASIEPSVWKQYCGCSPMSSCWLCQFGVNVASSRDHCNLKSESVPSWILKRIPYLMSAGSSRPKRTKKDQSDPEKVFSDEASYVLLIRVGKLTNTCPVGRPS